MYKEGRYLRLRIVARKISATSASARFEVNKCHQAVILACRYFPSSYENYACLEHNLKRRLTAMEV